LLLDHRRDGKGYPKELIPINPKKVIVLKGPDGMPYYQLPEVGEILPMRMMHHVKVFSLDGYIGSSPFRRTPMFWTESGG
jgi:phage portal protein BeeE